MPNRNWIFFSSIVILFNKWIISEAGFRKLAIIPFLQTIANNETAYRTYYPVDNDKAKL